MIEMRYVQSTDQEFWYSHDKHLPEREFEKKVNNKRGYVLSEDNKAIARLKEQATACFMGTMNLI